MTSNDLIDQIQQAYPRLWHACHVGHRTRAHPHESGLTDRESGILAHIALSGTDPAQLAAHLGVAKSTLSAHLARLESLALITLTIDPTDQRRRIIALTDTGREARRRDAVLDTERVRALLAQLTVGEQEQAVRGLVLLADAASRMTAKRDEEQP
jgi:DNA-binding MarR family transcriptional regulator